MARFRETYGPTKATENASKVKYCANPNCGKRLPIFCGHQVVCSNKCRLERNRLRDQKYREKRG